MNNAEIKKIFKKELRLNVQSISFLGKGVSNINYLVKAENKKFVFRLNANLRRPEKSKKEFNSLKAIEPLKISPKPIFLGKNFIILEYVEGIPFTNKKITSSFIINLAKLVAKLHSFHTDFSLPIEESKVTNKEMNDWLKNLKENLKNTTLLSIILKTKKELEKEQQLLKKLGKIPFVIAHGDICEQNILKTKKGLVLIDFEDLSLKDSADEIAKIFVDFGVPFNKSQKKLFLKEYFKIKKDNNLEERIKIYEKLILFIIFVWSIDYVLRIKNKEMHKSFLNTKELKKGLEYTDICFKRAIKFKIINKKYLNLNIFNELK